MFDAIGRAFGAFNPIMSTLQTVQSLADGLRSGNLGQILSSASQLAMTYATGGAGALFSQAASIISTINQASQLTQAVTNPGADGLSTALTGALGVEAGIGAIEIVGKQMGLAQSVIDAAQAVFAEQMGSGKLEKENARQAGMGNWLDSKERAQANVFLDMIKGNASQGTSIADTVGALIAGPNAGAVQLGAAMGMVGGVQNAVNNLIFALFNQMQEEMRGSLLADANGNRQAGQGAAAQAGAAAGNAGSAPANGTIDLPVSGRSSDAQGGVASSGGESILMKIAKALGEAMDDKMEKMAEKADALGNLGDVDEKNQSEYGEMSAELTALGQELKILQESLNNTLKSIGESTSGLARKQ